MLTWTYSDTDTLAVNIGLSCDLLTPVESLSEYWEQNHRAILQFIQQVVSSILSHIYTSHIIDIFLYFGYSIEVIGTVQMKIVL